MKTKRPEKGDLIITRKGEFGILVERDQYQGSYFWRVAFTGKQPRNYGHEYGWLETNILNRAYGKLWRANAGA